MEPFSISVVGGASMIAAVVLALVALSFTLPAAARLRWVGLIAPVWLFFQTLLAVNEFYIVFNSWPPRFLLAVGPPVLCLIFLFSYSRTRLAILDLPFFWLTLVHVVRIPVEVALWALFHEGLVPVEMTFEGLNYDILVGLSAPAIAWFFAREPGVQKRWLLLWNVVGLCLLVHIVGRGILSAPLPVQMLAFDRPNYGVMYFPYIWIPAFVVPLAFFAHVASLWKLRSNVRT